MQSALIVLLSIASAVAYGILHDQVTARLCVEYFTIGHPPVFPTESPTLLALGWGTIATWWCGLILGVPLALIARAGSRPKLTAGDFLMPIAVLSERHRPPEPVAEHHRQQGQVPGITFQT